MARSRRCASSVSTFSRGGGRYSRNTIKELLNENFFVRFTFNSSRECKSNDKNWFSIRRIYRKILREFLYFIFFFWIEKYNVRAIWPAARSSQVEPKLSKIKNEHYRNKPETYNGMPWLRSTHCYNKFMFESCPWKYINIGIRNIIKHQLEHV